MKYIQKAKSYLFLLTDSETTPEQVRCLIGTASLKQLNAISEILFNLIYGNLKLNKEITIKVRRYKALLDFISTHDNTFSSRMKAMRQHIRLISSIIIGVAPHIKSILK